MLCLFWFQIVATCSISIVALVACCFFGFRVGLVGVRLIVLQIWPGVVSRRVLLLQKIAVLCVLRYICVIALIVMTVRIVFLVAVVIGKRRIAAAATRIGGPGKHCCLRSWSALLSKIMGTKIHIIAVVVVKRSGRSHPWALVAASGAAAIVVVVIRIVVSHEIFKGGAASASTSKAIVVIVGVVGGSYHVRVRETADTIAGRFAGPPEPLVRKRLGRIHLPALLALEAPKLVSVFATFEASDTAMEVLAVLLTQVLRKQDSFAVLCCFDSFTISLFDCLGLKKQCSTCSTCICFAERKTKRPEFFQIFLVLSRRLC